MRLFNIQTGRLASGDFRRDDGAVAAFCHSFIPPCFSSSGQLPCETISSCDTPTRKKFTFAVNLRVRSVIGQNVFTLIAPVPPLPMGLKCPKVSILRHLTFLSLLNAVIHPKACVPLV